MARRKKHEAHENHERWLVSYADFITLLFAFFVVMFATSQTDKSKAAQVSESVKEALAEGHIPSAIAAILGGARDDKGQGSAQMKGPGGATTSKTPESGVIRAEATVTEVPADLNATANQLREYLKAEIGVGKIEVSVESRGLVVSLKEAGFFGSGDDALKPESLPSMQKLASVIVKMPNSVRLEGHTDAVPIHTPRFKNNWQLSAARGVAMLELLEHRFGLPSKRLAIAGYADTMPADTNENEAGRQRNRRVDVVILSAAGARNEPRQSSNGHGAAPAQASHQAATPSHAPKSH